MKEGGLYITYKRMSSALFSWNRAAYLGILIKLFRPFTLISDKLRTKKITNESISDYKIPPCILLVSPSRSGSTLIYQVLARTIPCVYISNYHTLYPSSASKMMLRKNLFGKAEDSFNNYYGYTSSLYDVSEGNEIMENIFEGNPNRDELRRRFIIFLIEMNASKQMPLIFKNVRCNQQILTLHKAIPELHFLRISREEEQVAQSMLKAYHELGYFHYSENQELIEVKRNPAIFSVNHLLSIEKKLDNQFSHIPDTNIIHWRYEDFCINSQKLITTLATEKLVLNPNSKKLADLALTLRISTREKVSEKEAQEIRSALNTSHD